MNIEVRDDQVGIFSPQSHLNPKFEPPLIQNHLLRDVQAASNNEAIFGSRSGGPGLAPVISLWTLNLLASMSFSNRQDFHVENRCWL